MAQRAFSRLGVDAGVSRDELIDTIAHGIDGTWWCSRVWEAWSVGTMSSRDFQPVSDSDIPGELADAILASVQANGWKPIETAPLAVTDYLFCELTWGPEDDACTGQGFRFQGKWYAAAIYHVLRSDRFTPRFEYRMVEVTPTHWRPGFSTPYEVVG